MEYFYVMDRRVQQAREKGVISEKVQETLDEINAYVNSFTTEQNNYPVALEPLTTVAEVEENRQHVAKVILALNAALAAAE